MDLAAILSELDRMEQLKVGPSAYYVNSDDYEMLKASCCETETPALDGIALIPSKHVPRGAIWPADHMYP